MTLTNIQQVRLFCGDRDSNNQLFSDDEIQHFINQESGDTRYAAAAALESLAASMAVLPASESSASHSRTRNPEALIKAAKELREQSDREPAMGVIEQGITPEIEDQIVHNQYMRTNG